MNNVESVVRKKIAIRGLVNSGGQAIPLFAYAVAFWYGGLLVANGEMHYKTIIM